MSEDYDLDPELRMKLLNESLNDGSDIFHIRSKDYVDEVQESVRQYNKERNLYLQKALGGSQGKPRPAELLKAGGVGDVEDILELLKVPVVELKGKKEKLAKIEKMMKDSGVPFTEAQRKFFMEGL